MKKILCGIVVIIASCCIAVGCNNRRKTDQVAAPRRVVVLKINNEKLLPILDSIIRHEKNCAYYSPDLYFGIHNRIVDDTLTEFQIGGIGSILADLGKDYYKGCFKYDGHWFFVTGQSLDKTVFANTNDKKEFVIYKTDWVTKKGEIVLLDFEDERYSYWIYHYDGKVFYFKDSSDTYCNCNDF